MDRPASASLETARAAIGFQHSAVSQTPTAIDGPLTAERRSLTAPDRRGGIARSLLMTLCGIALLCGSAAIFNPSSLHAVTSTFLPQANTHPTMGGVNNHQEFANTLAGLVERCVEVIAVHDRGKTPYSEIVLWVHDRANPGVIDQDELAVISHSQLFRTVAVYGINSCGLKDTSTASQSKQDHTQPTTQHLAGSGSVTGSRRTGLSAITLNDRQVLSESSFCDTWRGLVQVKPCVIATGVSDLRLEPTSTTDQQLSHLRISLTWSADSVDGAGEADALVNLSARSMPSQQE